MFGVNVPDSPRSWTHLHYPPPHAAPPPVGICMDYTIGVTSVRASTIQLVVK